MSALLTRLLALSVGPRLLSSKVSHISQPSENLVVFSFYGQDQDTRHLAFSLRLGQPLFFLLDARPPSRPKPTNFLSSLRKHLEFARLSAVDHRPGERIVRFTLETPDGQHLLAYEGLSKYPNLILAGPDGLILSATRYLNDVERPVLPQAPYRPPPQGLDKPSLWELEGKELDRLAAPVPPQDRAAWLKQFFRGGDPETVAHLAASPEGVGAAWDGLRKRLEQGAWGPVEVVEGPPPALRLFPRSDAAPLFHDPVEGAARYYHLLEAHESFLAVRRKLEQELRTALKREKRILDNVKGDRVEAERADQYQWWGELLMAHLHALPPHSTGVDLEDLTRGTGGTVHIPLDPGIPPLQSAQKFFRKARKGVRGLALVESRERQVKERLEELKAAERSLPALRRAEEVRAALSALFGKKAEAKAPPQPKEAKVPTPNVVRKKLNKDWEMVAGTSASANEYVTFQLAQPEDLWFHVRDFPGSHVILRRLRREAADEDGVILEAALTAAGRSKAPAGTKVTVSYTEKKNVKRIPGMGAGMVSYSKERSMVVETPQTL